MSKCRSENSGHLHRQRLKPSTRWDGVCDCHAPDTAAWTDRAPHVSCRCFLTQWSGPLGDRAGTL